MSLSISELTSVLPEPFGNVRLRFIDEGFSFPESASLVLLANRPQNLLGMRFLYPVLLIDEVIFSTGEKTSQSIANRGRFLPQRRVSTAHWPQFSPSGAIGQHSLLLSMFSLSLCHHWPHPHLSTYSIAERFLESIGKIVRHRDDHWRYFRIDPNLYDVYTARRCHCSTPSVQPSLTPVTAEAARLPTILAFAP